MLNKYKGAASERCFGLVEPRQCGVRSHLNRRLFHVFCKGVEDTLQYVLVQDLGRGGDPRVPPSCKLHGHTLNCGTRIIFIETNPVDELFNTNI